MSDLWTLQFGGTKSLPILSRGATGRAFNNNDLSNTLATGIYGDEAEKRAKDPINVVDDFKWTNSPKSSRIDVPSIQLIEQRLIYNSTVTNIVYSILASADTAKNIGQTAGGLVTKGIDALASQFTPPDNATDAEAKSDESFQGGIFDKIRESVQDALRAGYFKTFGSDVMQPYDGLYALEYTGFNYFFPYLENKYRDVNNQFAEATGGLLASIGNLGSKFTESLAGAEGTIRPGTYIEKSKQFTVKNQGRTITFNVPLLNTDTFEDVRKNWQLIFGLIYQNRPGRISKSIIDVPVIYEVLIPGMLYMPYAYISGITVDFIGNRRIMEMDVPIYTERVEGGDSPKIGRIKTVIPDAYQLSITVQGLNDETRNFMYASVKNNKLTVNKPMNLGDLQAPGLAAGSTSDINPALPTYTSSTLPPIDNGGGVPPGLGI
jgi:hypothetical protein